MVPKFFIQDCRHSRYNSASVLIINMPIFYVQCVHTFLGFYLSGKVFWKAYNFLKKKKSDFKITRGGHLEIQNIIIIFCVHIPGKDMVIFDHC